MLILVFSIKKQSQKYIVIAFSNIMSDKG